MTPTSSRPWADELLSSGSVYGGHMAKPSAEPVVDVDHTIARLRHAKARIVQCVEWARATEEAWRSLNQAGEVRRAIAASPTAEAAFIYERATRDAQIVMITRVLDPPSRGNAVTTDRMSLPVCRDLLRLPGVSEKLIAEARDWNELDEENCEQVRQRLDQFEARLQALHDEHPNRARILRNFRDGNIAHELHFDVAPAPPLYRHIPELLEEVKRLTVDLSFIVEGDVIHWRQNETHQSAARLWEAVATRYPLT